MNTEQQRKANMKKYITERVNGKYIIAEFNWSITKDANRLYAYKNVEDAIDEANDLNRIVERYAKLQMVDGV